MEFCEKWDQTLSPRMAIEMQHGQSLPNSKGTFTGNWNNSSATLDAAQCKLWPLLGIAGGLVQLDSMCPCLHQQETKFQFWFQRTGHNWLHVWSLNVLFTLVKSSPIRLVELHWKAIHWDSSILSTLDSQINFCRFIITFVTFLVPSSHQHT